MRIENIAGDKDVDVVLIYHTDSLNVPGRINVLNALFDMFSLLLGQKQIMHKR